MPTETVNGLLPNTSYEFQVYASNSVGNGPNSTILTVLTKPKTTSDFSQGFSAGFG